MLLKDFIEVFQLRENQKVIISIENNENQPSYVHAFELSIETPNLWTEDFYNKNISVEKEIKFISIENNTIYISLK